ncbi:MAG TPA: hypothetical protein DIW47_09880 [Bacteroidetes bacterium]|nr:hypothetical protein [Bacteroidota bacterium]
MLFLALQIRSEAQQFLLASQEGKSELTLLGTGAVVKFQYRGYSGQFQEFKGRITAITADTIFMESLKLRHPEKFQIAVVDILGFRGYSNARSISKSLLELGLAGGNLALYYGVIAPAAIGTGPAILISVGTGVASYFLIKALFPEKVKNTIGNGWSFKVIERK